MRYNLDSAMVIVLRDAIRWESAVVTTAGTLTPIDENAAIDPLAYQRRDRELGFRDLVNAAAVIETSVQVCDVWNYPAIKPKLQGPVTKDMPPIDTTQMRVQSGNASVVRHVQNVSIALDAARYADADLYGRDALIYETLARACQDTFAEPPISRLDSTGTIFGSYGSIGWSLAEGYPVLADINAALPMGLNTFKQADQNLADRDSQLAGYTANLAQILKNPFEYALRIYVQVTGTDSRESEVYSLHYASASERIWVCEPALSLRNRIVYDIADKTLQWFRESDTEVHQPQIVAMAIPGIDVGQTVTTLSTIPEGKDAQYWRSKAGQVKPPGLQIVDTGNDLTFTSDTTVVSGGYIQPDSACLTVPNVINFTLPYSLPVGQYRVSVLMEPNPNVTIYGNQNTTSTVGSDGGATYGTNYAPAPTTIPTDLSYRVIGGDGIVYNGNNYLAGQSFTATASVDTYTNIGPVDSKVHQYGLGFRLALPPGPWTVEMGYTNLNGDVTFFGIKGQFIAQGQVAVNVIQDAAPQPFLVGNGTVVVTPPGGFDVPYLSPSYVPEFDFPIYWTYGDLGQLGIQHLTFRSGLHTIESNGSYVFSAGLGGQVASAYVDAENYLPETVRFDFNTLAAPVTSPVFSLSWQNSASQFGQNQYLPVKLKQVQVQFVGTNYAATPLADEFQGWRQECLDRAEMAIQQGYSYALAARVAANGTLPTFRSTGSYWSSTETENWMAFVETTNPRLREVASIPATGYLTEGRQYEVTTAPVTYNAVVYSTVGDRFYATAAGGRDYTGGAVKQVGAFMKSKPGHIGKPALMPNGLYFSSYGTVAAYYDTNLSYPVLTTCTGWMVDAGLYVAQSEFWMPNMI